VRNGTLAGRNYIVNLRQLIFKVGVGVIIGVGDSGSVVGEAFEGFVFSVEFFNGLGGLVVVGILGLLVELVTSAVRVQVRCRTAVYV
jgi:hypothetical protein